MQSDGKLNSALLDSLKSKVALLNSMEIKFTR